LLFEMVALHCSLSNTHQFHTVEQNWKDTSFWRQLKYMHCINVKGKTIKILKSWLFKNLWYYP
jgi:hypothetical protein